MNKLNLSIVVLVAALSSCVPARKFEEIEKKEILAKWKHKWRAEREHRVEYRPHSMIHTNSSRLLELACMVQVAAPTFTV